MRSILILGALVAALGLAPLSGVADAEASNRGVRLFVVDWRLTWEEGTALVGQQVTSLTCRAILK